MTRVVVTGMGTVNPLGNDVVEFKENLFAGKLGIAPITKFDASETGITNAGEVKNFDPTLRVGKKAAKRMDLYSQYAVDTALQAIEDAGITEENTASEDMGVIFGSGIEFRRFLFRQRLQTWLRETLRLESRQRISVRQS